MRRDRQLSTRRCGRKAERGGVQWQGWSSGIHRVARWITVHTLGWALVVHLSQWVIVRRWDRQALEAVNVVVVRTTQPTTGQTWAWRAMVRCEVSLASQQGMCVCCACWACGSGAGSARSRAVALGGVAPGGGEQHQEGEHAMVDSSVRARASRGQSPHGVLRLGRNENVVDGEVRQGFSPPSR